VALTDVGFTPLAWIDIVLIGWFLLTAVSVASWPMTRGAATPS
jgi:hypothetical protein